MHPSPTTAAQAVPEPSARVRAIAAGIEKLIVWIGSPTSLLLHTLAFIAFFTAPLTHMIDWDTMFLSLTTVVSLEAIYLSIFIQFSVNRQAASLKEVEEDVESIQEDVEELGENVEEIKEEIEEISEDEGEEAAEDARKAKQAETLEALTRDVKALLQQLETLKPR